MTTPAHTFARAPERRQFGRRQTALQATIATHGRPSAVCIVRDISTVGARVELSSPSWLPSRFRLIVEATKFEADCEIVHRTDVEMAVRFL